MKENTFHYLCNVRTSPNGFRCCEKWIRLYAKPLIKAFRGKGVKKAKAGRKKSRLHKLCFIKASFHGKQSTQTMEDARNKVKRITFSELRIC